MFVLFFRWRLHPDRREQFMQAWPKVTRALLGQGSHGSVLFDGPEGTVCAIARWPDRATRDASSARAVVPEAWSRMRDAIAEELAAYELTDIINLWAPFPPPQ